MDFAPGLALDSGLDSHTKGFCAMGEFRSGGHDVRQDSHTLSFGTCTLNYLLSWTCSRFHPEENLALSVVNIGSLFSLTNQLCLNISTDYLLRRDFLSLLLSLSFLELELLKMPHILNK